MELKAILVAFVFAFSSACGDGEEDSDNPANNAMDTAADATSNGTDDVGNNDQNNPNNISDMGTGDQGETQTNNANNQLDMATAADMAPPEDMGNPNQACDFEAQNGIVVIEAESLPLNENWQIGTDGDITYIEWTGSSHNNDPTHGVMEVEIRITEPGRYQLQWYTQIGMGTNTTEHNDAWVKFPDAADYYGLKGEAGAEIRRYWKPICEDDTAMAEIEAMPEVDTASCAEGSTRDGWMKVYSSGATDWRWSARTSDNDASNVMAEFPQAGVYTFAMAARADFSRYDRILLHREELANNDVRDLSLPETVCD